MKSTFKFIIGIIIFLLVTVHLIALTLFICPAPKLLNLAGYNVDYMEYSDIPDHVRQIFADDIVSFEANREYIPKVAVRVLSFRYDRFFDGDERQELYLNTLDFGEDIIGIEKASNYYFNKPVSNLSFEETLTLNGLYKVFIQ